MFDFIRNIFRYKAKSVEEFVEVVKREGCKTAIAEPYSAVKGGVNTTSVGAIANFQYILEFTSVTPHGRNIVYRQRLFERFGSDHGFSDAEERRDAAIELFLLGEQKVKELRVKLPGIAVDLIGPNGRLMDEAMYSKLHHDAATCGVSV